MCYNIAVQEKKLKRYFERYAHLMAWSGFLQNRELPANYFVSGFANPPLPFIKADGLQFLTWGLIPAWAKDQAAAKEIRTKTLNAVGETVFEKPSFRGSIKSKRGLLPVSGFFEWMELNKKKYPHYISLKDDDLFSLGCLHETWTDKTSGEIFNTFCVITTPANPMMERIHNTKKRMPLIIAKKDEQEWIDPDLSEAKIKKLIKPFDEKLMKSHTINMDANSPVKQRNREDICTMVEYPELELAG